MINTLDSQKTALSADNPNYLLKKFVVLSQIICMLTLKSAKQKKNTVDDFRKVDF